MVTTDKHRQYVLIRRIYNHIRTNHSTDVDEYKGQREYAWHVPLSVNFLSPSLGRPSRSPHPDHLRSYSCLFSPSHSLILAKSPTAVCLQRMSSSPSRLQTRNLSHSFQPVRLHLLVDGLQP